MVQATPSPFLFFFNTPFLFTRLKLITLPSCQILLSFCEGIFIIIGFGIVFLICIMQKITDIFPSTTKAIDRVMDQDILTEGLQKFLSENLTHWLAVPGIHVVD